MAGAPVELVHQVPLFADLDDEEVAEVARSFKQRHFSDGETVIKEGLGGAAFFLIESGEAKVSVAGRERAKLGPGDYFGEIALIDEGARSATLVASGELACYGITLWEFRPLVQGSPAIAWKLLQALAKRLRTAEQY